MIDFIFLFFFTGELEASEISFFRQVIMSSTWVPWVIPIEILPKILR